MYQSTSNALKETKKGIEMQSLPFWVLLLCIFGLPMTAVMMLDSFGCQTECLNGGSCVMVKTTTNLESRNATYECRCTQFWEGIGCEKYVGPPTQNLEDCHNEMRTLLLVFLMVNVVLIFVCFVIVLTYACNRKNIQSAPTPEKLADILYKRLKTTEKS